MSGVAAFVRNGSQPDGSLLAAFVAEQKSAHHSGKLLRFVLSLAARTTGTNQPPPHAKLRAASGGDLCFSGPARGVAPLASASRISAEPATWRRSRSQSASCGKPAAQALGDVCDRPDLAVGGASRHGVRRTDLACPWRLERFVSFSRRGVPGVRRPVQSGLRPGGWPPRVASEMERAGKLALGHGECGELHAEFVGDLLGPQRWPGADRSADAARAMTPPAAHASGRPCRMTPRRAASAIICQAERVGPSEAAPAPGGGEAGGMLAGWLAGRSETGLARSSARI